MKNQLLILLIVVTLGLTGCSVKTVSSEELKGEDLVKNLEDQVSKLTISKEYFLQRNINLRKENENLKNKINELENKFKRNSLYDYHKSHFEPTISPEEAKLKIEYKAAEIINAISQFNVKKVSEFIHPTNGVRFTQYSQVSLKEDLVFSKKQVSNFKNDSKKYLWGYYDGIGSDIKLTPREYWEEFVYDEDYKNAVEIGYNNVLGKSMNYENQFAIYHDSIVVEYYFPGFDPKYDGMDWKSLRIVFQKYGEEWFIVGIIHNEYVI